MARDVEADVNINDKSSKGLGSFLSNLRKADQRVQETQKGIDKAGESTGKLGKKADENAKAFAKLSRELEVSKKELGDLARAFADAGTAAERTDISKAMRKQQTEIRNLSKNRDILKDLLPQDDEVEKASSKIGNIFGKTLVQGLESVAPKATEALTEVFSGAGEAVGPVLVGVIAASLPLIGATISGAIIGGIGLGGVVGGFALAAQDPRVQAAFTGMKGQIGDQLKDAAQPFVETSINGIAEIGGAVKKIDFDQIFADSATNAIPIIDGITTAIGELGGAITDVIHNSGPAVKEIGNEIAAFSGSIANGFESIADNGQQGADALHQIFLLVNGTVDATFSLVNGLTEVFGVLEKISGGGPTKLLDEWGVASSSVAGKATAMAQAVLTANGAFDANGQVILTDGAALGTFSQQIDAVASAGHSLFDSATNAGAAVDAVTAAIKKNGKTLDENTTKGRANREALSSVASSLVGVTKAAEESGASQRQLNKVAGEGRTKFIDLARQFGLTKTQAGNLATQMGLIPAKKNSTFTANTHDAAGRIEALKEQVAALHDKTVTVHYRTVSDGRERVDAAGHRIGGYFDAMQRFAAAGPDDGLRRSGGPGRVDLVNHNDVTVLLDGKPFRAYTDRTVSVAGSRAAWRQKVGKI